MARWLVTGCSTGFGREIARGALQAGHSVVVTARRADAVQDLADEFGDRALAVALDVTDAAQIADAVGAALEKAGLPPAAATSLLDGGLDAVHRDDLQVAQRADLAACGSPVVELPRLPDGIDLGALYELAEQLRDLA